MQTTEEKEIERLLDECWTATPCMVKDFNGGKGGYVPGKVHHLDYQRVLGRMKRLVRSIREGAEASQ